jgi:hypothetical protein
VNELPLSSFVAWLVHCGFAYGFYGHKEIWWTIGYHRFREPHTSYVIPSLFLIILRGRIQRYDLIRFLASICRMVSFTV